MKNLHDELQSIVYDYIDFKSDYDKTLQELSVKVNENTGDWLQRARGTSNWQINEKSLNDDFSGNQCFESANGNFRQLARFPRKLLCFKCSKNTHGPCDTHIRHEWSGSSHSQCKVGKCCLNDPSKRSLIHKICIESRNYNLFSEYARKNGLSLREYDAEARSLWRRIKHEDVAYVLAYEQSLRESQIFVKLK